MGVLGRRAAMGLVAAGLAAATASSDEILLRGGGRVSGVVVERTSRAIVVETGPGRVTLSMALVERVIEGRSALEAHHERAAALEPRDVEGWAALARWAAERDLLTQVARGVAAGPGRRPLAPRGERRPRAGRGGRHLDGRGRGVPGARVRVVRGTLGHPGRARGPGARAGGRGGLGAGGARGRDARPRGRGASPGGGSARAGGRVPARRRRHPLRFGAGAGAGAVVLPPEVPWQPDPQPPVRPSVRPPIAHPPRPQPPPAPQPSARPQPPPAKPAGVEPPPRARPRQE